ncbi:MULTISPECIES: hypothetical protein [unclassified Mesorhizobium]|uniref:hypothetical protein n=1 Tax=unclassified Mesorhizobium TaxID=325217 RepID=UPI001FE22E8F|nr:MULTISPECIES: hypothetical protein [unclassified Mesorhizobium]MDG4899330.1 hypothetical protein [Mesorhizobium sp. WSM4962]MDG4918433.1 hypothetical protein [Mesorhizobium sp. WSM4989]
MRHVGATFAPGGLAGLAHRVQQDYVHDDNKHAHESLSADSEVPPMPSSLTSSFVLHDVARLPGKRFEQRSRRSSQTRGHWQVRPYLSRQQGIHLSADARQELQTLCLIKSNLLEACAQPAVDREKVHV